MLEPPTTSLYTYIYIHAAITAGVLAVIQAQSVKSTVTDLRNYSSGTGIFFLLHLFMARRLPSGFCFWVSRYRALYWVASRLTVEYLASCVTTWDY